jgi:hypothetical protein
MADEKDRLGEALQKKKRGDEEKYFAEIERERLANLRAQQDAEARAQRVGACPRCGHTLLVREVKGIAVDECPSGDGVWLDAGELEQLGGSSLEERSSMLKTVLSDLGILGKRR